MGKSLVSVIIPTYNRAAMLEEAIQSALRQTCRPAEVIVVDDASKDSTRAALESVARRDARVRPLFLEKNRGPAGARNAGVAAAKGDVVAFLDSDDLWHADHLESATGLLESHGDIDVVFADIQRVNAAGTPLGGALLWDQRHIRRHLTPLTSPPAQEWFALVRPAVEVLLEEYIVPMQTMVLRSSAAKACHFDESFRVAEDYDFTLRLARAGHRFGFVKGVRCRWVIHDQNLVSNDASGSYYAGQQARVWLSLLSEPAMSSAARRLLRRRISKWHFDEAYHRRQAGERGAAFRLYLRSWAVMPSWRSIRAAIAATLIPGSH